MSRKPDRKRKRDSGAKINQPTKLARIGDATDVHTKIVQEIPAVDKEIFCLPKAPVTPQSAFKSIFRSFWNLDFRSIKQIYYLSRYQLKQVDGSIIPNCGQQMPLMGRQSQYDKVWKYAVLHLQEFTKTERNKYANVRIFVIGSPGIGKTRFALQLPRELARRASEFPDEEIKRRFANTLFVHISFDGGAMVSDTERAYWKDKPAHLMADYMLVSRALKSLFGIPIKSWDLNNLPSWFNMEALAAYLSQTYSTSIHQLTIYWHLDEIQSLVKGCGDEVTAASIQILTGIFKDTPSILLFSGTMIGTIEENLPNVNFSTDYPPVHIRLQPLTSAEVHAVVQTVAQMSNWRCIPEDWQNICGLKRLFDNTGGVPRIVELVLQTIWEMKGSIEEAHMIDIQTNVMKLFKFRYNWSQLNDENLLLAAVSRTLTGQPYQPPQKLAVGDKHVFLESLVASGMMQTTEYNNKILTSVPFLSIILLETKLIPQGFHSFWNRLRDPMNTFSWQEFESLSCLFQMLRVKAFSTCGTQAVELTKLFAGAACYGVRGLNLSVVIGEKAYFQLKHHWPGTTVWPESQQAIFQQEEKMANFLFGNAEGAAADAIDFYELTDFSKATGKDYVMIAHQNKFTRDGQTELKAEDIIAEWKKVMTAISKNSANKQFKAFIDSVYMVLFFFTNRFFQANIQQQVESLWDEVTAKPCFVITNDLKNYLGPFGAVVPSFN